LTSERIERTLAAQHQVDARGDVQVRRLLHAGADLPLQARQQPWQQDPFERVLVGQLPGSDELVFLAEAELAARALRARVGSTRVLSR
jgi:hypothetical protein